MTDKLKELALAANRICNIKAEPIKWFTQDELLSQTVDHTDDAAYIAAASPDAILALISDLENERRKVTELVDGYEKDQAELKRLRSAIFTDNTQTVVNAEKRIAELEAKLAAMESLLGAALGALRYHTEQTRPIKRTYETIAMIEASVASLASGAAPKENT